MPENREESAVKAANELRPGRMIGAGGTAEVYALDGERILKLFRPSFPKALAAQEFENARAVGRCGLPTPEATALVDYRGRSGIIYRRADGRSILAGMLLPWKTAGYARLLAALHAQVHLKSAGGLRAYRQVLARSIRSCGMLTAEEKTALCGRLSKLPDGDRLCHGDFHPDNVLLSSGGPVILDWMTACAGDPAADVARTALILQTAEIPGGLPRLLRLFVERRRQKLHDDYLCEYFRLTGMTRERMDAWLLPIAAARLVENRPEKESARLLAVIRENL